jgi:hypothetical protein
MVHSATESLLHTSLLFYCQYNGVGKEAHSVPEGLCTVGVESVGEMGLSGQKLSVWPAEVKGATKELGLGSPWLICSRPVRAVSSGSLSQAVEQPWDVEGQTEGLMIGGRSSSFSEPMA